MNFFQHYRAKQAQEIEPSAVEPSPLPDAEEMKAIDTVKAIHVDDEQYALLTRALRPEIAPVRDDLKVEPPGPNVPPVVDRAGQPPAGTLRIVSGDQPPGTPIV